jgi:putative ABC transport system permease protein
MIWAILVMAVREVGRNTMRSVLTTLGIVIGVASVIAMITIGRAASSKITSDIEKMGSNLLIVMPGSQQRGPVSTSASALTMEDARAIARETSAASLVSATASRGVLVVYGSKNWNTSVTGADNAFFGIRGFQLERGEEFSDAQLQSGAPACILGATVRRELLGKQDPVGAVVRVGAISCTVSGTLLSKGPSAVGPDQDDMVVMPLRTFQRRIAGNSDVGAIYVSAKSERLIPKAKTQMEDLMRERRRVPQGQSDDFNVQDMKEISSTLGTVTQAMVVLLGAIAGVSLLVGGIGIMNIMLVSVTERTREIGLRLSIGARAREVLLQFLIEAVVLSTIGGVIGVLLGLLMSYGAGWAFKLPVAASVDVVALAFAFSTTIGVVFGILPARKAARLNPIEALRHE